jgi:hypothetical protein
MSRAFTIPAGRFTRWLSRRANPWHLMHSVGYRLRFFTDGRCQVILDGPKDCYSRGLREELAALRKVAETAEAYSRRTPHSGACLTSPHGGRLVVTSESCRCDESTKAFRAAMRELRHATASSPSSTDEGESR